jgi:hypothetical protein
MSDQTKGRRALSNALIAIGAVLLLGVAGYFLWGQYQGYQLRAQLRATPAPALTAVESNPTASPSPSALPPTIAPSPTSQPPSATAPAPVAPEPSASPSATSAARTATPVSTNTPTASPTAAAAGPPVRLVFADPVIHIDTPVVEMGWTVVQTAAGPQTEWVIPENEAGHHIDSVELGQPGNLVISGHNNIYGRVFEPISLAWPAKATRVDDVTEQSDILNGRTIQLYTQAGQRFDYVITDFLRLKDTGVPLARRIENARYMRPTDDTRLTLVTCWPPWSNTHRLIVIAKPAPQS